LIRGLIALAESSEHHPVNIGNPDEFTLLELAETVISVTSSRSEIVHVALPTADPKQRRPDTARARDLLGWEPKVSLRDGLQRTIEQAGVEALVGAGRGDRSARARHRRRLSVRGTDMASARGGTDAPPRPTPPGGPSPGGPL